MVSPTLRERIDFNRDGNLDILWRNDYGALAVWCMGGSTRAAILSGDGIGSNPSVATWSIADVADYTGNGTSDILWRVTNGTLAVWAIGHNDPLR